MTSTSMSSSCVRPAIRQALLLSVLAATGLHAQTTQTEQVVELPAFTVAAENTDRYRAANSISASRVRADLIDTPSSITVLTRELIDDIQPARIFDATRYVAGVQEGRGITFSDRQIIRGFESSGRNVDNFLDPTGVNYAEALVDRIEVSKGPNAILSPGGVPGGAINIITKAPSFKRQRSLTALVGLYDAQQVTLDLTDRVGQSDKFAYRFIGSYQDSERYWDSDAKLKRKVFSPSLTWRIGKNTELTVRYSYDDYWCFREPLIIIDASVGPNSTPIPGAGFKPDGLNGIDPWSHLEMKTHAGSFLLSTAINEHISTRLAGRASNFVESSEQEIVSTAGFSNRYNPSTGDLTQDQTWTVVNGVPVATTSIYYNPAAIPVRGELDDGLVQLAALQNDWVFRYEPHGVKLQTVTGWAVGTNHGTDTRWSRTLPAINLITPGPGTPEVDWNSSDPMTRNVMNQNFDWQAYINQRVTFFKDRATIVAGILRYGTQTSSGDRLAGTPVAKLDDDKDMHLLGGLYKVRPNASVYYTYSTNATPTIANNLPLWREGKQRELGAKWEVFEGRLAFNLAHYEIAQTNVSVPNPDRLVDPTAPGQLISNLKNHGWELEVSGAVNKNLSVFGGLTRMKMRDSLGRHVRAVADDLASLMLNYKFTDGPLRGLSLNAGAVYTSKRAGDVPAVNFTALNVVTKVSFFVPSYTFYNFGASYNLSDKYLLRLYVDNVFDKKDFIQLAGSRVATGTATGRNVRVSATWKF